MSFNFPNQSTAVRWVVVDETFLTATICKDHDEAEQLSDAIRKFTESESHACIRLTEFGESVLTFLGSLKLRNFETAMHEITEAYSRQITVQLAERGKRTNA